MALIDDLVSLEDATPPHNTRISSSLVRTSLLIVNQADAIVA